MPESNAMRLPNFPSFNFSNPFRRNRRADTTATAPTAMERPSRTRTQESPSAVRETVAQRPTTAPERNTQPSEIPASSGRLPHYSRHVRFTGVQPMPHEFAPGLSGANGMPPPDYSNPNSRAHSPAPAYQGEQLREGEQRIEANQHPLPLGLEHESRQPRRATPRVSLDSISTLDLNDILDSLGPLSRFPTPPPRPRA